MEAKAKKILNQLSERTEIKSEILTESSLSKMWQHIENNGNFGIISPFRRSLSLEENVARYKELKSIIRDELKLGYIELEGGFREEGKLVKEKSLFIPNIKRQTLLNLGEKYEQFSVIYKDDQEFVEIGTNEIAGKGSIKTNFIKNGWNQNLTISSEKTKEFFSRLLKGSHKNNKFMFNLEESYLLELVPQSFNEIAYHKDKKQFYIKLI